jgi:uncharacterized protein (DUF433 family)
MSHAVTRHDGSLAERRRGRGATFDPRELPNYRLPEAAHYLRIPESTLRSWIFGQTYPTAAGSRTSKPIVAIPDGWPPRLSFVNVVEAHVLSGIRYQHGVTLPAVRRAIEYLTKEFGSKHPLAEEQFQTDGVNLFVERLALGRHHLINVSAPGQLAMREILCALLRRIERDERGLAIRLYPFSRRPAPSPSALDESPRLVVIDPRIAFGRPVLVGTGITTFTIAERFDAGESMEALAHDYGLSHSEIEEAIRCELTRRDAA